MSVKIAIIDSGINPDHFHVDGIEKGLGFYLNDKKQIMKSGDFTDIVGHGTAIAGIIKKKAPFAKLYAVKIFNQKLTASASVLIAALNWAIDNRMQIVNLSLGTKLLKYKKAIEQICAKAYKKNIFIVSSAKHILDITFPAVFNTVIGVCKNPDCNEDTIAYYPKNSIEFGACGMPRAIPGLPQELNFSGASFAAAHISGIIASKLKKNSNANIKGVKRELTAESINVYE
ncbi:MAG: S8 family serine peptidase [Deltaproteobacteria bacterium]|nr:S8 family serine peptidase [Deltaproteobacteria bacterium]